MKVIFVASGNKKVGVVNSFVQSQFDSLKDEGLDMILFPVRDKGVWGYLKAVISLRVLVRREKPDIVHAHYSTCGFVASLACLGLWHRPKIMVSILGSFPTKNFKWRRVRWAIQHLWDGTLTKSERTRSQLGLNLPVIPNGVNMEIFKPMDYEESRKIVGFEDDKKYVIWCSNPNRPEKKWSVANNAIEVLKSERSKVELIAVYDKTPQEVAIYMNAADCLLLTSVSEGSPNVIKEAMACNCPIVTTDVGDVKERLSDVQGCYIADSTDSAEIAKLVNKALLFGKRTNGKEAILSQGITIEQTAKRIIKFYSE